MWHAVHFTSTCGIEQAPTKHSFNDLLQQLKGNNRRSLTVLLLGRSLPMLTHCLCQLPSEQKHCTSLQHQGLTHAAHLMALPDCSCCNVYAGKAMMGKSSTANALFNEPVASVTTFQQDTGRPTVYKRTAHGFELTVIDTPGLLDGDRVSTLVSIMCASATHGRAKETLSLGCTSSVPFLVFSPVSGWQLSHPFH